LSLHHLVVWTHWQ